MIRDRKAQEEFHNHRSTLISRLRDGKRAFGYDGPNKKELKNSRGFGHRLLPPQRPCMPVEEYWAKVSKTIQKKAGHEEQLIDGKRMVVFPPDPNATWTLQPEYNNFNNVDETLASQEGSEANGIGSEDDEIEDKYEDLMEEHEEALEQSAQGCALEELMDMVAEEEAQKEQDNQAGQGQREEGSGAGEKPTRTRRRHGFAGFGGDAPDDDRTSPKKYRYPNPPHTPTAGPLRPKGRRAHSGRRRKRAMRPTGK